MATSLVLILIHLYSKRFLTIPTLLLSILFKNTNNNDNALLPTEPLIRWNLHVVNL